MGRPRQRPTTDTGKKNTIVEGNEMADYRTPNDSVEDQLLWLEYSSYPLEVDDVEEFAEEMKARGYFTDDLDAYANGLNRFL